MALLLSPAEYIDMVVYTLYVDRGWKSGVKHSQATVISDQPWSSISTPRKVICNNQCEIGARRRCHGGKIKRGDSYLCTTRINTKNKQMYKKDSGWVGVCAAVVVGVGAGVGAGVVLIVDSREKTAGRITPTLREPPYWSALPTSEAGGVDGAPAPTL